MRYLALFARLPLLPLFQAIINKLLNISLYIFKHPLKSIFLLVKVYFCLLLIVISLSLFFSTTVKANTIFDTTPSSPFSEQITCETFFVFAFFNFSGDLERVLAETFRQTDGVSTNNNTALESYKIRDDCGIEVVHTYNRNSNTTISRQVHTGVSLTSSSYFGCPEPDGSTITQSIEGVSNGVDSCFSAFDLQQNDTCGSSNPDVLGTSSSPSNVCQNKSDGSSCYLTKYEENGQFAYTDGFEESCYGSQESIPIYEQPVIDEPELNQCSTSQSGELTFCDADPQICDLLTGDCPSGCGSFDLGGGARFGCISDDLDNNNVADSIQETPVIVDDGTPTDQPSDADSDSSGIPVSSGSTNSAQLSEINSTLEKELSEVNKTLEDNLEGGTEIDYTIPDNIKQKGSCSVEEDGECNQKTISSILQAGTERLTNSPIFSSINGFFDVNFSGSCPVYSANVPFINTVIVIDHFCSSLMNTVWPIVWWVLVAVFSFISFRWAVL